MGIITEDFGTSALCRISVPAASNTLERQHKNGAMQKQ